MQARVRRVGWLMAPLLLPIGLVAMGLVGCLLFGALLVGCGAERAVRVEVGESVRGDRLCLVAHGAGEVQFAEGYDWATLPDGERSLTFVAGDRVRDALTVTARVAREGQLIATATSTVRFADQGVVREVLRPARCVPGTTRTSGERPGGTFAALAAAPRVIAADLDGDGGDELCAIGADGSLQALDAEDRETGSRRLTELRAPMGTLAAVGDLDGDCRLEVVAADPLGALVVLGSDGSSAPPIGSAPRDVAIGVGVGGAPALVLAGAELSLSPWDEDAPASIATGAFTDVEAGDLTGDGRGDLVAASDTGVRAFVAGEDALSEEPGMLPAGLAAMIGPIALGDLDADGALDLVAASGTTVRIAINRGDGLLEDRTGTPPTLPADAVRIALGDLDGDCADEIVIRGADGSISVLTRDARGALVAVAGPSGTASDLVILDADADGARELAIVRDGGAVTLWRP